MEQIPFCQNINYISYQGILITTENVIYRPTY